MTEHAVSYGLRYLQIAPEGDELVCLDAERRLYAGLSRDRTYWHIIQPLPLEDPRVGDGLRKAGELGCTCPGGVYHGRCYRVGQAEAFEAGRLMLTPVQARGQIGMDEAAGPDWLYDAPVGAGEAVEAFRG